MKSFLSLMHARLNEKANSSIFFLASMLVIFLILFAFVLFGAFGGIWLGSVYLTNLIPIPAILIFIMVVLLCGTATMNGIERSILPKAMRSALVFGVSAAGIIFSFQTGYWGLTANLIVTIFWLISPVAAFVKFMK